MAALARQKAAGTAATSRDAAFSPAQDDLLLLPLLKPRSRYCCQGELARGNSVAAAVSVDGLRKKKRKDGEDGPWRPGILGTRTRRGRRARTQWKMQPSRERRRKD